MQFDRSCLNKGGLELETFFSILRPQIFAHNSQTTKPRLQSFYHNTSTTFLLPQTLANNSQSAQWSSTTILFQQFFANSKLFAQNFLPHFFTLRPQIIRQSSSLTIHIWSIYGVGVIYRE